MKDVNYSGWVLMVLSLCCIVASSFLFGFQAGRSSIDEKTAGCRYMNELHEAGFRFYDPEGYEIDRWAE